MGLNICAVCGEETDNSIGLPLYCQTDAEDYCRMFFICYKDEVMCLRHIIKGLLNGGHVDKYAFNRALTEEIEKRIKERG